jgi:hypothetical protein
MKLSRMQDIGGLRIVTNGNYVDKIYLIRNELKKYTNFEQANKDYLQNELRHLKDKNIEIVLVSIQDIRKLKQSYPNYFMDTTEFIKYLKIVFESFEKTKKQREIIGSISNTEYRSTMEKMSDEIFIKMIGFFDRNK